jgi:hypothetical protein
MITRSFAYDILHPDKAAAQPEEYRPLLTDHRDPSITPNFGNRDASAGQTLTIVAHSPSFVVVRPTFITCR